MQPCPEGKLQMKDMKILIQSHGLYVDIHRNKLLPIKPLYCIYQHILSYWKAVLSCMFLFSCFQIGQKAAGADGHLLPQPLSDEQSQAGLPTPSTVAATASVPSNITYTNGRGKTVERGFRSSAVQKGTIFKNNKQCIIECRTHLVLKDSILLSH